MRVVLILFASIISSNIALSYFLGMCPFVTISRDIGVAAGMGAAVTAVMTLTAAANWLINYYLLVPLGLEFLQFLVFIVTIATISSMAFSRASWENASPLIDLLYRPSCFANLSKAALLYQPAVPVFFSLLGFSKKTPRVSAP